MTTTLSPAAQILAAFRERYVETLRPGPFVDHWQEQCLAAALRAAADQVAPSDAVEPRNYLPAAIECQRIRAELLAIAAELEGHQ
jgi:hypothetical protein